MFLHRSDFTSSDIKPVTVDGLTNVGSPLMWHGFELTVTSQKVSCHCNTACYYVKKPGLLMKTSFFCAIFNYKKICEGFLEMLC